MSTKQTLAKIRKSGEWNNFSGKDIAYRLQLLINAKMISKVEFEEDTIYVTPTWNSTQLDLTAFIIGELMFTHPDEINWEKHVSNADSDDGAIEIISVFTEPSSEDFWLKKDYVIRLW